ncbi:MAG: hypothetical protein IJY91_01605 [Oscillospiraceae bacterium]|nr:hypothetical protein [Oscillospiraceae bacterium]
MKKVFMLFSYLLFVLTALLPVGELLFSSLGYHFRLSSYPALAGVTALVSVSTVLLRIGTKEQIKNKFLGVLLCLLSPLSLLNAGICIYRCSIDVLISALIFAGCSICLTVMQGTPFPLQMMALSIFLLALIPLSVFCFFEMTFGSIGVETVIKSVDSPNGEYFANVIDRDEGALGGSTRVDVCEKGGIYTPLFEISKKPQIVYFGSWGEFENMTIHWKNDTCLVINGKEYEIGKN